MEPPAPAYICTGLQLSVCPSFPSRLWGGGGGWPAFVATECPAQCLARDGQGRRGVLGPAGVP